jgi:peptidoglycan-associated lipoprotein
MSKRRIWNWGPAVLAVMMLLAFGCAKKQEVKSTEGAPGAPAAPPAAAKEGPPAGITTETMKPETPKPSTEERLAAAEAGAAVTKEQPSPFQDIHFDFDKSAIREDAKPVLAAVADYLKKNKGAKLLIEGHCDERGTPEYNMALGDRRAESAQGYLASLGIPKSALSTVSFGKEKPADSGHGEAAWAKNRRAHFVLR